MTDIATAEMLWVRAHDAVRRGELASAVKDLARCYEILHAQNDPRVYEVHRRWTEVHQMYLEDGAREPAPAVDAENTLEKQAEAKANAGDLDGAIGLYGQAAAAQPHNELVRERLQELIAAKRRADELTGPKPAAPAAAAASPAPAAAPSIASVDPFQTAAQSDPFNAADAVDVVVGTQTAPVLPKHSFEPSPLAAAAEAPDPGADDWSDVALTPDPEPQVPVRAAAPVMKVEDAPVGMPSLELTVDLGDELDAVSEPTTETVAPVAAKNPFDTAFDSVKIDSDEGAATGFGEMTFSSDGVPGAAAARDPSLARMALLEELLAHVQRVRAERASGASPRP